MEIGIQREIRDLGCISTQSLNLLCLLFLSPTFLLPLEMRAHNCGATDL